ncbi:MAG: hypothetical protein LBJ36_07135 [Synergistaceae bacterium]|jgi:hypothetical protein|nr:hypothetical protein [Synergistaceae bacterium]
METQRREPQMGLTFEKVWAALMELREESKETDLRMKETDLRMKETDLRMKETDRLIRELREESKKTDLQLEKTARQIEKTTQQVEETSRSIGGLNNSFGELAEHLVAPNIQEKFNALGYHFKGSAENQKIKDEQGKIIAEIDILLENRDYIVAVEVKSKPKNADINNFAKRLETLRKYKDENNDKRKIRGAIAGAVFYDSVKKAVLKAGFYVIEQAGDTMKINIPVDFKPKEW